MDQIVRADLRLSLVGDILFRVLDALWCGAVLLDYRSHVVHENERAREYLRHLPRGRGTLLATAGVGDALLQAILGQAATVGVHLERRSAVVALPRQDRRPLVARVVPVDREAQAELCGAVLILLLIDPEDCPRPAFELLGHVFGLTRAEARVASGLLRGRTLAEIAREHRVSLGTVRPQAKAILAKTRTSRQAELVGLLTRIAFVSAEHRPS